MGAVFGMARRGKHPECKKRQLSATAKKALHLSHLPALLLVGAGFLATPALAAQCQLGIGTRVGGFMAHGGALLNTTGPSGRKLGAYNGHYEPSLETCINACVAHGECAGVTYRSHASTGNTCLMFARTDYETGETRRKFISTNGVLGHVSAIVRDENGQLCYQ